MDEDLNNRNRLVGELVTSLADGKFSEAVASSRGSLVTAQELREAVCDYGRQLVPLPPEGYELIDYIAVLGSRPLEWSVVVPLFTREEGRSDLSLELSVIECPSDGHTIQINGLHAL